MQGLAPALGLRAANDGSLFFRGPCYEIALERNWYLRRASAAPRKAKGRREQRLVSFSFDSDITLT